MRIKHLLFAVMALPLLFVACKPNTPVDEVKNPTIELTAGEATFDSLSFTVTTTEADYVAWLVVEASETTPTASEVLANGTAIEANKSVECKATGLEENTEYTIVAAVKNASAADRKEIKMTTIAADPEAPQLKRVSEAEAEFAAEGGNGEIEYEVVNPVEGTEVEAAANVEWITDVAVAEKVTYTVTANEGDEREGKITVSYGDLEFEVKIKQAAKAETPKPEVDFEFTASVIEVQYYGTEYSAAYNYYIYISDVGLNENGNFKADGNYYLIDLYAADSVENSGGYVPNGTYKLADNYAAGTFSSGDYGANVVLVGGVPTYNIYTDGTVVVSDNKIEATITMENGEKHHVVFEGDLKFTDVGNDNPDNPGQPTGLELNATSWIWGGSTSYGNKYSVAGEGFSLDVHFPAEYATESRLADGDYIWTSTTWWGYNDFDNEFTTRSFLVDGAYSYVIREGSAVVALNGEEYDITLTLKAEEETYIVKYTGTIGGNNQGGGEAEEVVFTKMEFKEYNSSYWFYEYTLSNENGDRLNLCVNDYQAKEGFIYTDDTYEWISIGYCGNLGYFSTRNISVGGTSLAASSGSMIVVTDDSTHAMDITITLALTTGDTKVFKFSGKVGEDNSGNEGGDDNTGEGGDDNTGEGGDDNTGEGGDDNTGEGGETTSGFENWVFTASISSFTPNSTITFTDGSHTVTCKFNQIAEYIYAGDTSGYSYAYDFTVNGEAVNISKVSGTIHLSFSSYKMTLDLVIDGVKYTGTSTNAVAQ